METAREDIESIIIHALSNKFASIVQCREIHVTYIRLAMTFAFGPLEQTDS